MLMSLQDAEACQGLHLLPQCEDAKKPGRMSKIKFLPNLIALTSKQDLFTFRHSVQC